MKRWGPKTSTCPSKPRENILFGRISGDLGWRPTSLRNNVCVHLLAIIDVRILGFAPQLVRRRIERGGLEGVGM